MEPTDHLSVAVDVHRRYANLPPKCQVGKHLLGASSTGMHAGDGEILRGDAHIESMSESGWGIVLGRRYLHRRPDIAARLDAAAAS
jgi:hypothetical protein